MWLIVRVRVVPRRAVVGDIDIVFYKKKNCMHNKSYTQDALVDVRRIDVI